MTVLVVDELLTPSPNSMIFLPLRLVTSSGPIFCALRPLSFKASRRLLQPMNLIAAGGFFTRPHIGLVAERGPEAVVPLSRGSGLGHHVTINYSPTIQSGGAGVLSQLLRNHAEEIANHVQRALENTAMRTATV